MRASDLTRLSTPFSEGADAHSEAAAALGVAVPRWNELEGAILADLAERAPYGIGWWAPHPGTARRILISDQLYACARSVSDNLIEGALHWLEFLDYADRESDRFANALTFQAGEPIIKAPRPRTPLEVLGPQLVRVHVAGLVRALASSFDCLAGVIVAIVALPTGVLRADLRGVRELLRKTIPPGSTEGERMQAQFAERFETLIRQCGPPGWLDWTLQFRNMLVHRGRRIEIGQFVPREPVLYGADGQPVPRVRVVTHLPRDPGRSDVEVFLDPDQPAAPVLAEDAEQTLSGLLASARDLIDRIAKELLDVWSWRRENSDSLSQPRKQWPKGPSTDATGFAGYAPESFKYSPTMMTTHPIVVRRLRAAALDDQAHPNGGISTSRPINCAREEQRTDWAQGWASVVCASGYVNGRAVTWIVTQLPRKMAFYRDRRLLTLKR